MLYLISFELKKLLKSRKNILLLLLFTFILVMYVLTTTSGYSIYNTSYYNSIPEYIKSDEAEIKSNEEFIEENKNSADYNVKQEIERVKSYNEKLRNTLPSYNYYIKFYETKDLSYYDKSVLLSCKAELDYTKKLVYELGKGENSTEYEVYKLYDAQYNYYKAFVDNGTHIITKKENMTGFSFLYLACRDVLPKVLPILILLLCCDMLTTENRTGSIKFLLIQPVPRAKILISKLIAGIIASLIIGLVPILLVFVAIGLVLGFGSFNMPVLVQGNAYSSFTPLINNLDFDFSHSQQDGLAYNFNLGICEYSSYGTYVHYTDPNPLIGFIAIGKFILGCLPLIALMCVFFTVLSLLIAVLVQRNVLCIFISAVVGGVGVLIPSVRSILPFIGRLNPYIYCNSVSILSGTGGSTMLFSCIYILLISVAIFTAALTIFKRRDIVC